MWRWFTECGVTVSFFSCGGVISLAGSWLVVSVRCVRGAVGEVVGGGLSALYDSDGVGVGGDGAISIEGNHLVGGLGLVLGDGLDLVCGVSPTGWLGRFPCCWG